MGKKKKKEPKVEKVFESEEDKKAENDAASAEDKPAEDGSSNIDDFLGKETPEDHLTEKQKKKLEKLDTVKNKISKILQSSNIEIVDENFDDEYEFDAEGNVDGQSQQDYDSLKAMFGEKDKNKKQELTLTIDEFDYSYIGQYLEEYDLMHMKNIKKVKIQKKHSPKLKKFMIAAILIVVIGVGAFCGYYFTRTIPVYLKSVALNQSERSYYVGKKFDYTGLYFIAEYSDGRQEKITLDETYFNSGISTGRFDKNDENEIIFSNNGSVELYFTYSGFNVKYAVTVTKKNEEGVAAYYTPKIFDIDPNGYITAEYLRVFVDYGAYGQEQIDLSRDVLVKVNGNTCSFLTDGYKVDAGTDSTSVITIEYGGKSVRLDNTKSHVSSKDAE